MSSGRWDRVSALYAAALERAPDVRAAFLAAECGDDLALRQEVESLLQQPDITSTPALAAMAPDMATDGRGRASGARLSGYRLGPLIGKGGMGDVYRARDETLARDVAIKMLPPAFAADAGRRARFEREARVLASINHPHIAAIYGVAEGEGHRGLVLELVDGETLAERLQRGALPIPETLRIARQFVDALDAAHERGIVHRDLKPANIKITPEGVVKVLDFGLATAVSGDAAVADLTQSPTITVGRTGAGVLLGTAPYMSPEQARGLSVDKRTDIWAFGCVLYEMLTGRAAFAGDTLTDTLAAIVEREPEWTTLPKATPAGLALLIRRCLQKNVKRRLRDIGDAMNALDDETIGDARREVRVAAAPSLSARIAWTVAVVSLALGSWLVYNRTAPPDPEVYRFEVYPPKGTTFPPGPGDNSAPLISPDGLTLAFVALPGGQRRLWVRPLDSTALRQLVQNQSLQARSFDVLKPHDLGEPFTVTPDRVNGYFAFSVSETGVLAYSASQDSQLLAWMDRFGKPLGFPLITGVRPVISRDGNRIIVDRHDSQSNDTDLRLIDRARSTDISFTSNPREVGWARFSPDAERIVFTRRNGKFRLFVKRTDGVGSEEPLPVEGDAYALDWSSDGRHILFMTYAGEKTGFDLWALPLEGTRVPFPVAQTEHGEREGRFSPDARFVAYDSTETGRREVWVQPFPPDGTGTRWRISTSGGVTPQWRQDGRELFYVAGDGTLMGVPITRLGPTFEWDTRERPLFQTGFDGGRYASYAVSTDGRHFLTRIAPSAEDETPITVLTNWTASLRR